MESVVRFQNQPELSSFLLLSSTVPFQEEVLKRVYKYLLIHPLTLLVVFHNSGDTLRYENLPVVQFEKQKTNRYALFITLLFEV